MCVPSLSKRRVYVKFESECESRNLTKDIYSTCPKSDCRFVNQSLSTTTAKVKE
jgi:hypothetical protein